LASKCSSTKLHIRISWTAVNGSGTWLTPTQMKGIAGCRSKTPVAQMHLASEHPLAEGSHGSNGLLVNSQANSVRTKNKA